MDEIERLLIHFATGAWRKRWLGIGLAWAVCMIGWLVVMTMPPRYEAGAQIYVAADPVLTPLLRGIAIGSDSQAEFALLRRTLLSKPNLNTLIDKVGLDAGSRQPNARELLIRSLRQQVRIVPQTDNLFSIAYENPSPTRAYQVVQGLVDLYVERASSHSQGDINNANSFLQAQIDYFHDKLKRLEHRRATFLSKYLQLLPGANGVSTFEAEQAKLRHLRGELADWQAEHGMIVAQLAHTKSLLSGNAIPGVGVAGLTAAEARLAALRQRYTSAYPGVIEAEREVAALKREGGAGTATAGGPAVANPVYEQLHLRLLEANTTIFSLHRQINDATAELTRLTALARAQPGLQAEYTNLDRNYGVLTKEYQNLIARREAMRIGAAANIDANQIQLQVSNPPQVPHLPIGPHRGLLLIVVLVLGVGAGFGAAILRAEIDGSFETIGDLKRLGLPVLGAIADLGSIRNVRPIIQFGLATLPLLMVCASLVASTIIVPGLS